MALKLKAVLASGAGFLALVALGACGGPSAGGGSADTVFVDGAVYTADKDGTIAEAAAIKNGRILKVGSRDEIMALAGEKTKVFDLKGGMLLPGFTDAHVHLVDGGDTLTSLALYDAHSAEEAVATIEAYVQSHPDLAMFVGSGWALPLFPDANPNKALLDAIDAERPIILYSADGHNAWVNSAALAGAGITAETPDPQNGRIERDPQTGEPTGTLREAATDLVRVIIPPPSIGTAVANLVAAMKFQNAMGYTASVDAAVPPNFMQDAFEQAARAKELTLRITLSFLPTEDFTDPSITPDIIGERIQHLALRRQGIEAIDPDHLKADMVKIFVDGVLENHTAALIDPYINIPEQPDNRGVLNIKPDVLDQYAIALDAAGFNIHMHAIGSGAVREGLDAVEAAIDANPQRERHHHMAHIELINPADIPRFAELGVAANMQTLWAFADSYITDLTEPFLGEERSKWLYPNAALRDAGAFLVSGSDWPVSTSDPFDAIEVAVTRMSPDGDTPVWHPEQALAVSDMLRALTIDGAILTGEDDERGSIEPGKRADLVVISANPMTIAPSEISEIAVIETMLDGEPVYTRGVDKDETP
ncbi:MAG TPA: amidohydrolase [Parvularculaceae bacterium]|nr:amidohydrolase [Parvularculaceae bacterium]